MFLLARGIIDIDILSLVPFYGPLTPFNDMCHEMCFMCLHNGTVYINSATTILFRPPRLVFGRRIREKMKETYLLLGLFVGFLMVITCYVMSLIYDLKMIEFPKNTVYVRMEFNKAMNINICFGELTIFRSNILSKLCGMLKKSKQIFSENREL